MVNEFVRKQLSYNLADVLTEKQIHCIVEKWLKDRNSNGEMKWNLLKSEMKPAMEGISGFLGDHLRVVLYIKTWNNKTEEIFLFIKAMPKENKPKSDFIDESNYYRREMIMYRLFEEIGDSDGPNVWHPKAYICDERLVVMPDLSAEGYIQCPLLNILDYDHVLLTAASIARFHASFANYETDKSSNGRDTYTIQQKYEDILAECTFKDTPWLHAAAKLTANFLGVFSNKYNCLPDLELQLKDLYFKACDSLTEYKETLNVLIHKDLWINNIMFKYTESKPTGALLIDFQCLRYAPPGFDLMIFLYLNTDRDFRQKYEKDVFYHYFNVFEGSVNEATKKKLAEMKYDFEEFCKWCEKARMFSMVIAAGIFPYILMEPLSAQKNFDDPETFIQYTNIDRTKPVVEHAHNVTAYKERILEVSEELVERYLLN